MATAAFFFAGHGVERGGRNYLLPRDVPNIKPGRDEQLRRESLSLQEFLTDLREKGTRFNLVILDACREDPFEKMAGRSIASARGLAAIEPPDGTFIMFSAGSGESALDRLGDTDQIINSIYTRLLLPLLRTPGLSLTDIAEQVRSEVRLLAASVQHRQTPAYYNQVVGRVCVAGGDCSARVTKGVSGVAQNEAVQTWRLIEGQENVSVFEAFRKQFGDANPVYDQLAANKIATLKSAQEQRVAAASEAKRKADEAEKQRVVALQKQQDERKRVEAEAKSQSFVTPAPKSPTAAGPDHAVRFMVQVGEELLAALRTKSPAKISEWLQRHVDVPYIGLVALGARRNNMPADQMKSYHHGIIRFLGRFGAGQVEKYAIERIVWANQSVQEPNGSIVDGTIFMTDGTKHEVRFLIGHYGSSSKVQDMMMLNVWVTSHLQKLFSDYIEEQGGDVRKLVSVLNL